jgi:hypothetical protein
MSASARMLSPLVSGMTATHEATRRWTLTFAVKISDEQHRGLG